jgi:hypothetical protein
MASKTLKSTREVVIDLAPRVAAAWRLLRGGEMSIKVVGMQMSTKGAAKRVRLLLLFLFLLLF